MNIDEAIALMQSGDLYRSDCEELLSLQAKCLELQYDYNLTRPSESERRRELLLKMFAEFGEGSYIEPPFHANWAGRHVHFGKGVYANFGLTLVDDAHIYVGDYTKFGPNCVIATAGHPLSEKLRAEAYQFNRDIRIGARCWLGAGVIVLPGVTIGDGSVIGAGSVVTRDIPAGVLALGTPARVVKKLDE